MMNRKHVEQIFDEYRMTAIIIYAEYHSDGIDFFTPPNLSQQLASMKRPKGYKIPAHIHKPVPREVKYTQETLFIKKGSVEIIFYDENKEYLHLFVTLSPFREPLVPFQTALFLAIMGLEKRSFVDLFWQVSPKY